ncbi:MAG: recombination protein O N-terminal domain-containing protein, partial [Oscillospiraceae bacterium]|nr:recombination protein O N-terminal domain-containing protein [Oscillospiraceae bacterium]
MLVTYDGIVVGRREIGDSNLYLDILTEEQGIIE